MVDLSRLVGRDISFKLQGNDELYTKRLYREYTRQEKEIERFRTPLIKGDSRYYCLDENDKKIYISQNRLKKIEGVLVLLKEKTNTNGKHAHWTHQKAKRKK